MKCKYCNSDNIEIIARGTESILYNCKSCKINFTKSNEMFCDLCSKSLHPLDAHMGYIDKKLSCTHIKCWNEYYKEEIEKEKATTN